ncbi:hypothetical protein SARC_08133 [Sphaeroforma arctica JP610]|uniref:Uncharacterized protein n=1 Tax=Sphaeroforma arctica JP610 TaxID=667725 RepID=A0A0L0FU72_9EUKA|nr:hypothetical protein SARC_08133 [Sphaeroforma arctica JP610]KNC79478.1 hypothetical protein SARC_08133 [Sphaeroforma arctica JP610]|eukprot:XP_014153380.1 hypothetical protein SARC_08133 [Sphaeroforma arctica JP610]
MRTLDSPYIPRNSGYINNNADMSKTECTQGGTQGETSPLLGGKDGSIEKIVHSYGVSDNVEHSSTPTKHKTKASYENINSQMNHLQPTDKGGRNLIDRDALKLSKEEKAVLVIQRFVHKWRFKKHMRSACAFRTLVEAPPQPITMVTYVKAVVTLVGLALMWLGLWTQFDVGLWQKDLFPNTFVKDTIFLVVGVLLLCSVDCYYIDGGMEGTLLYPEPRWLIRANSFLLRRGEMFYRCVINIVEVMRLLASHLGSALVWFAFYDLVDKVWQEPGDRKNGVAPLEYTFDTYTYTIDDVNYVDILHLSEAFRPAYNVLLFCLGLGITVWTGCFLTVTGIEPEDDDDSTYVDLTNPSSDHLQLAALTLLSLFGQALIWVGANNFLEMDLGWECIWRELLYIIIGFAAFMLSDSFISNGCIETKDTPEQYTEDSIADENERESAGKSLVGRDKPKNTSKKNQQTDEQKWESGDLSLKSIYLRSMLSLVGAVTHNTAMWQIADTYIYPSAWGQCSHNGTSNDPDWPCAKRDLMYMCIGMVMLIATRTATQAVGISINPLSTAPGIGQKRTSRVRRMRKELLLRKYVSALIDNTLKSGDKLDSLITNGSRRECKNRARRSGRELRPAAEKLV